MERMRRLIDDESGQMHTMEGVIAGLMMVLVLSYIIGSITLVSPQTEKTTSVKLTIEAQDILTVLGTIDQSSNMSSALLRDVAMWKGVQAGSTSFDDTDDAMIALNNSLYGMLPINVFYNVDVAYYDDASNTMKTEKLIYMGEPYGSGASASKTIILNSEDVVGSPQWSGIVMPKAVDVRLMLWTL